MNISTVTQQMPQKNSKIVGIGTHMTHTQVLAHTQVLGLIRVQHRHGFMMKMSILHRPGLICHCQCQKSHQTLSPL